MPRLPMLALLAAASLAMPAQAQEAWRCANADCSLLERSPWDRGHPPPPSFWEPRHDPWAAPPWHRMPSAPPPVVTRREWLSQHDPRAWYGEPRQPWHAEDDRRHGRWRGQGMFD